MENTLKENGSTHTMGGNNNKVIIIAYPHCVSFTGFPHITLFTAHRAYVITLISASVFLHIGIFPLYRVVLRRVSQGASIPRYQGVAKFSRPMDLHPLTPKLVTPIVPFAAVETWEFPTGDSPLTSVTMKSSCITVSEFVLILKRV